MDASAPPVGGAFEMASTAVVQPDVALDLAFLHWPWKECIMGIVAWIVVGAIAGFVANMIAGGREGVIGTIILGIVGGLVGGFAATEIFHRGSVNGLNVESLLVATAGAVVVLVAWHLLTSRSTARARL